MKSRGPLILLVVLLLGADNPKDATEKELEKLQGDWFVVCVKQGSQFWITPEVIVQIKDSTVKLRCSDGQNSVPVRIDPRFSYTLKINPLEKPKGFDLPNFDGFGLPDTNQPAETGSLGIYKWDGECLKVNYNVGIDRPRKFDWVAILARDSKEERAAAKELWETLPHQVGGLWEGTKSVDPFDHIFADGHWEATWVRNQRRREKCEKIVKSFPKTAAATIAQDYVDYELLTEDDLEAAKRLHAQNLQDQLENELLARAKLDIARKLADEGIRLGRKDLKEKARALCREIIAAYSETTAAKEAKEVLEELSWKREREREELEASKQLDLVQKGPKENAAAGYEEIMKKYPGTIPAKKAQLLLDQLDNGERPARRRLRMAMMLAEDGLMPGKAYLLEKAKTKCREIIKLYPNSKAAIEAKAFLERLSK